MDLNELLKVYREEHGLSLREFAKRSGLSPAAITYLENGKNGKPVSPNSKTLEALAKAMNMLPNELVACLSGEELITLGQNPAQDELSDDEMQLLADYRDAEANIRQAAALMLHNSAEQNRRSPESQISSAG